MTSAIARTYTQQQGTDGEWRSGMLALSHDYSLEKLRTIGVEESLRDMHAAIWKKIMAEYGLAM